MRALRDLLEAHKDPERLAAALAEAPPEDDDGLCPTCRGARFVRYDVPFGHPKFGHVTPCPRCRDTDDELIDRLGALSGLPSVTRQTHRFSRWEKSAPTRQTLAYAINFANGKAPHPFLTFAGTPGTGKTHLAIAISWHFLEGRLGTVAYWQVETFLECLRAGYNQARAEGDPGTHITLNFVKQCSLLVLDDLGAEYPTGWSSAKLDEIIDHRYINRLATVFTLNVAPNDLPPRLADRLLEGKVIVLNTPSYRQRQRKERV